MDNFDDKYRKKNPFSVPEGYFDGLTDQIVSRIEKQEKQKKSPVLRRIMPYLGVVAVACLALLVIQILFPQTGDDGRKSIQKNETIVQIQDMEGEDIFDSQFNPTNEEIIEYLASEVDNYEMILAGVY